MGRRADLYIYIYIYMQKYLLFNSIKILYNLMFYTIFICKNAQIFYLMFYTIFYMYVYKKHYFIQYFRNLFSSVIFNLSQWCVLKGNYI